VPVPAHVILLVAHLQLQLHNFVPLQSDKEIDCLKILNIFVFFVCEYT